MSDNKKRILDMLADNKISVDEAQRLLSLVEPEANSEARMSGGVPEEKRNLKYLHVVVQPGAEAGPGDKAQRVNIRVPIALIRAGMKLTSLIPGNASNKVNEALREKGIDFDLRNLKTEDLEELVDDLSELEVDVQDGTEKVRVYVE